MKRRDFIAVSGGLAARPQAARAQNGPARAQTGPAPRKLGVLMSVGANDPAAQPRIAAFLKEMLALGWREGDTIRTTYRWAGGQSDLVTQGARELVALAPDVILANGTFAVMELKRLTRTIPVVCALVTDPVGLGFVDSLAHPGGNITGFSFIDLDLIRKWAALLKEAAPGVSRAMLPYNPGINPQYTNFLRDLAAAPQSVPIPIIPQTIDSVPALRAAITAAADPPGGSLIIGPESFLFDHMDAVIAAAAASRMPGIAVYRKFADDGGLMSYGPDIPDIFRHAAGYVDRILRGAKPADLPVQQPTLFEFVINQKTATALGLAMPASLLARADEVIE